MSNTTGRLHSQEDLARFRDVQPLASISQAVDALCAKHGYEPRHKAYPFETLAHRVEKLKDDGKKSHFSLAQAA